MNVGQSFLFSISACRHVRYMSNHVRRFRALEYWSQSDTALSNEFERSYFAAMVDQRPLVTPVKEVYGPRLLILPFRELKLKLDDYGLTADLESSALLDAVEDDRGDFTALFGVALRSIKVPDDSPISIDTMRGELASALGGEFIELRRAILTLAEDRDRSLLARMQALIRWSHLYRRCPKCASVLRMRVSKTAAACISCNRVYFPTLSPVAICLICNEENTHVLLIRHRGMAGSIFTTIAGFAHVGESLIDTVRREVAEEIGIDCRRIIQLNMSQSWPIPDCSLMCAFRAVADPDDKLDICFDELEAAKWFSRAEVKIAVENTQRGFSKEYMKSKNGTEFERIPPSGAIAHQIIKHWLEENNSQEKNIIHS